jgi:regulator of sigma E protease
MEKTARIGKPGRMLPIVIERDGKRMEFTITPQRKGREEMGDVGMFPLYRQLVRDFQPNSPALTAGLKRGDEIIRVNGVDIRQSGRTLQQFLQEIKETTFPITVLREEDSGGELADGTKIRKEVEVQVTPMIQEGRKMIGITLDWPTIHMKLPPMAAISKSIETNKENAVLIFQVIGRLLKREASVKQLDGPISIISYSGRAYQEGLVTLFMFMALISLNLGILNIMPIPILDGGVILLLAIEGLMGRDLSLRMKERIVQASVVFILMLMVIVLYNDVLKLLPPSPAP